jgi:hypothetical protein
MSIVSHYLEKFTSGGIFRAVEATIPGNYPACSRTMAQTKRCAMAICDWLGNLRSNLMAVSVATRTYPNEGSFQVRLSTLARCVFRVGKILVDQAFNSEHSVPLVPVSMVVIIILYPLMI